jgi:D-alanine-D-alanine ligase
VKSPADLGSAVDDALRYDRKVLVERAVDAREIECAVLGNDRPETSVPGEVVPNAEFYSYRAKYLDENGAALVVPADLPPEKVAEVRDLSVRAFVALELEGMARVDFLLDRRSDELFLNEVNTIPGFTRISMYPKLWEASGLPLPDLLDELIRLAIARKERRSRLSHKPPAELA